MIHALRWFVAALLALAAILLPPRRASNAEPTLDPAGGPRLLELANAERTERGLPPLVPRADLTDAAEQWALAMARTGQLAHDGADRPQVVGVTSGGPDDLHAGWMASEPHRAIILNPRYDGAGFGTAVDDAGQWWAVGNFAAPPATPPTRAALPPATTVPPVTTAPPRPVCTCPN